MTIPDDGDTNLTKCGHMTTLQQPPTGPENSFIYISDSVERKMVDILIRVLTNGRQVFQQHRELDN